MGKLADLAMIKTANSESFVYSPPDAAFNAAQILVKPAMGYAVRPPATVSLPVLAAVLRGLRRASPVGRIVILEGVTTEQNAVEVLRRLGVPDLLDEEMRIGSAEDVLMAEYPNLLPQPVKYASMTAPAYIAGFDCVISVGAFKRTMLHGEPLISASLKNLYGFFPRSVYHGRSPHARGDLHLPSVAEVLKDVYFTIGTHIDGAVVDLTHKYVSPDWRPDRSRGVAQHVGKVVWGDDMLAVDEAACRLAGEAVPDYIPAIRALRRQIMGR